jgi:hypothetical protein
MKKADEIPPRDGEFIIAIKNFSPPIEEIGRIRNVVAKIFSYSYNIENKNKNKKSDFRHATLIELIALKENNFSQLEPYHQFRIAALASIERDSLGCLLVPFLAYEDGEWWLRHLRFLPSDSYHFLAIRRRMVKKKVL